MLGWQSTYEALRVIVNSTIERQEQIVSRHEDMVRRRKWIGRHQSLAGPSPAQSGRLCPQCRSAFLLVGMNDLKIDVCRTCGGFWFDAGDIRTLAGPDGKAVKGDLLDKPSPYKCPSCAGALEYRRQSSKPPLRVHACPAGHGFYIEKGEYMLALHVSKKKERSH